MIPDYQDKQAKIIDELKCEAKRLRFGTLKVELKVHEGVFVAGEVIEIRKTLG